jgi:outer membrane protein assembly factor BamA
MKSNPFSTAYKFLYVLLLFICFLPTAHALEPFQIQDIRIEGLQRTEPGTVLATIPFRVGENYSDEKGTLAIRNLFALGLFKDVRIEVNAAVVVVIVEERPIIGAVDFVGINNRSLKSFEVNIEHSLELKNQLPKNLLSIAESGIYSLETFKLLKKEGFDGFLMGEYFMKQSNPAAAFEAFVKSIKTDNNAI